MAETFAFDVFLSHSSKDKDVVRALAERLRDDGVRVWFDEWEIQPGDSIPAKVNEGLAKSRVLFLFLSGNATGSDYVQMEHGSFLFRDPLNRNRRFIPVRLDDADIPVALAQFLYVDWQNRQEQAYEQLLKTCLPVSFASDDDSAKGVEAPPPNLQRIISLGHTDSARCVAISPDGNFAISGSDDRTLRKWDLKNGRCLSVMEGHSGGINSVAISQDGRFALSGAGDKTIRKWDIETGSCLGVLSGHTDIVWSVAISQDGKFAVTGSEDNTIRKWDVETGQCLKVIKGHTSAVYCAAISPDGKYALSGSKDISIRKWDLETGTCLKVLTGHTDSVRSVAISQDGRSALSASVDDTVRKWDLGTGKCRKVLDAHKGSVWSVAISPNGRMAFSASFDNTVRKWDTETGQCSLVLKGHKASVNCVAISQDAKFAISASKDNTLRQWDTGTGDCVKILKGHTESVWSLAVSQDAQFAVSGSSDGSLIKWDLETGQLIKVLEGHAYHALSVAISQDDTFAISGSGDRTLRKWDLSTGRCSMVLEGNRSYVHSVAISQDGKFAISGGHDNTVRKWDLQTGKCLHVLEGHADTVETVAISQDGKIALSGSIDNTIRKWDIETGKCLKVLQGHNGTVRSVAISQDSKFAITGGNDNTLRKWDLETGKCLHVLEGHTGNVLSVCTTRDGRFALSCGADNTIRKWDIEFGKCLFSVKGHAGWVRSIVLSQDGESAYSASSHGVLRIWRLQSTTRVAPEQLAYKNAKVLFVGDSGVGKSGLARRIRFKKFQDTASTDGVWATQWELPAESSDGTKQEIWLWDFAGQNDYRLVHQLFIRDAQAAVFVFNPQQGNPFEVLGKWDRDLEKSAPNDCKKLLVAGRVDRGGLTRSQSHYDEFMVERGFTKPLHLTSAKTEQGIEKLEAAIQEAIDWNSIPTNSSPIIFERLKSHVLELRDQGKMLVPVAAIKQHLDVVGEIATPDDLSAVLKGLERPGHIMLLSGDIVLLQPEILSRYTAAVVRSLRAHPQELGCISESTLLSGVLDYQDFSPVDNEDHRTLLKKLNELCVERKWCLRQPINGDVILSFPSYFRRERKSKPRHPSMAVTFEFDGHIDDIYATLVVLLHHTEAFDTVDLWRNAADFRNITNQQLGINLISENEGHARLEIHFDPAISDDTKALFQKQIGNHLLANGKNVCRVRHYACLSQKCRKFDLRIPQEIIDEAIDNGDLEVLCTKCGSEILLVDTIEKILGSDDLKQRALDERALAAVSIDNESRELQAVHHAGLVVSSAGQIMRLYANSDHGIDAEIEFRDDKGNASGKRLYLQLKSGDSYLRARKRDDTEIFQVKNRRWASYWKKQAYPVLLVIRTSDKEIRWMDVSDYLKQEAARGKNSPTQIEFRGEPFNELSILKLRAKYLGL